MNDTSNPVERSPRLYVDWLAAGLAFALMALLFPIHGARMPSAHSWRAELLTTLFLIVGLIVLYKRDNESLSLFNFEGRWVRLIVFSLAAFIAWSFFSAFWAHAPFSTWHHTLVWAEYILFFLFVSAVITQTGGVRFVTGTFLWLSGAIGVLCLIDYATLPDFTALEGILRSRYSSYAELLVTALPLLWIAAIYARKKQARNVIMLTAILGWTTVMLSLSKGAFIAGLVGFGFTFICSLIFGLRGFRKPLLVSAGVWVVLTLAVQVGFSLLTPIPATVDYISGKADATRSTSTARLYMWRIGRQMAADHWLFGVGADNYGVSFNEARSHNRITHPDDPNDEMVSDNLVERGHNEPLQMFAEMGIIGTLLVLIPVGILALCFFRAFRNSGFRLSPMLWAAMGGMLAFAISSMVSSFSFRLVQTGIVFFMVFAVAVREILKADRSTSDPGRDVVMRARPNLSFALIAIPLMAMLATYFLKAEAEYFVYSADRTEDTAAALDLYRRAVYIDPDYSAAYLHSSGRNYAEKDFVKAAGDLRIAIDQGLGVVLSYSALVDCEIKIGDRVSAETTFVEALRIFPRSVFLRVRYALFLNDDGRSDDYEKEIAKARAIDSAQANGWLSLLTIGSVRSFYAAQSDTNLAPPADLLPAKAVLQYLDAAPGQEKAQNHK
jgi:O-antigen ligase